MTAENAAKKRIYDVFLSFSDADESAAAEVEVKLGTAGLSVFNPSSTLRFGAQLQNRLWEELGACSAVVAVFGERNRLTSNQAFEIGAAMAWKKPIYGLVAEGAIIDPSIPASIHVFPAKKLDYVAKEILAANKPLTEGQRQALAQVYENIGTPTDQLTRNPAAVDDLTERFNARAKTHLSGERLMRELLVLRKRGGLPRLYRRGNTSFRQPA